jgi:hypothetical protein
VTQACPVACTDASQHAVAAWEVATCYNYRHPANRPSARDRTRPLKAATEQCAGQPLCEPRAAALVVAAGG